MKQEFKALLGHLPDLRTKLESAARANQSNSIGNGKGGIGGTVGGSSVSDANKAAPTIKLKMDFSNFS